jgi:DNA-binding NarL/FixJ family response regulator
VLKGSERDLKPLSRMLGGSGPPGWIFLLGPNMVNATFSCPGRVAPINHMTAGRRILCIEDDRETAALLAEELLDRGYQVSAAYDGEEGLAAILKDPPDLVLADVSLPVMCGFEVLERVMAAEPRFRNMPFVFLTALADRDNELKGWQLGADDYVTKPVDFDVLDAVLKARLARVARPEIRSKPVHLAEREIETLTWAARGKTSAEIALILGLSKRTVDFHLDNARSKLGVATRTQAVMKAATAQLIEP